MYCRKCGAKQRDQAKFCGKCGAQVSAPASSPAYPAQNRGYTVYEKFDCTSSLKFIIGDALKLGSDASIPTFVLTDRSLIFNGTEVPFEYMTVIRPEGYISFDQSSLEFSLGGISTTIDGVKYKLKYSKEDMLRLLCTISKVNRNIPLKNARQKLQYALMMTCFLMCAETYISRMHIIYSDYLAFEELTQNNTLVTLDPEYQLSQEQLRLIEDYTNAQRELNDFYKRTNAIANAGNNRKYFILKSIIDFMDETDTDVEQVVQRYNDKLLQEEVKAALEKAQDNFARDHGYYDDDDYDEPRGESFLGGVAKVALGVAIGNKISGAGKQKKQERRYHYTCSISCPYRGKGYGPTKCRRDPATCGHGMRY